MRQQTNTDSDNINHKPCFLLILFITNKILNRHLTEVGNKSIAEGGGVRELYKVKTEM